MQSQRVEFFSDAEICDYAESLGLPSDRKAEVFDTLIEQRELVRKYPILQEITMNTHRIQSFNEAHKKLMGIKKLKIRRKWEDEIIKKIGDIIETQKKGDEVLKDILKFSIQYYSLDPLIKYVNNLSLLEEKMISTTETDEIFNKNGDVDHNM